MWQPNDCLLAAHTRDSSLALSKLVSYLLFSSCCSPPGMPAAAARQPQPALKPTRVTPHHPHLLYIFMHSLIFLHHSGGTCRYLSPILGFTAAMHLPCSPKLWTVPVCISAHSAECRRSFYPFANHRLHHTWYALRRPLAVSYQSSRHDGRRATWHQSRILRPHFWVPPSAQNHQPRGATLCSAGPSFLHNMLLQSV